MGGTVRAVANWARALWQGSCPTFTELNDAALIICASRWKGFPVYGRLQLSTDQDAWLLAIDPVAELCYTLFQRGLATGCDSMKECLMVAPVARVEEL